MDNVQDVMKFIYIEETEEIIMDKQDKKQNEEKQQEEVKGKVWGDPIVELNFKKKR